MPTKNPKRKADGMLTSLTWAAITLTHTTILVAVVCPRCCSVGFAGLNFNLVVHVFSFLERDFPQWNKLVLTQRDWKERSLDTAWVKLLRGTLHVPTESSPRVVKSGVRWVTKMTALTQLNLAECTSITDSGVVLLSSLTSLAYLNLKRCCRITCASMQSLSSLTGLT